MSNCRKLIDLNRKYKKKKNKKINKRTIYHRIKIKISKYLEYLVRNTLHYDCQLQPSLFTRILIHDPRDNYTYIDIISLLEDR